ncbi:uncharacterized protein An16g06020, partial [Aspergillus niger]|uniref:Uncharacterized protein n=2 Tax=Aspergillus niger TaxID=5061 RepID=A0AAJ8BVT3_ASPNG
MENVPTVGNPDHINASRDGKEFHPERTFRISTVTKRSESESDVASSVSHDHIEPCFDAAFYTLKRYLPSLRCSFLCNLLSLLYLLLVPMNSSLLPLLLLIPLVVLCCRFAAALPSTHVYQSVPLLYLDLVFVLPLPHSMSPPSSLRGGHQMARLRVPQSSPSSSSSLPPSGQKDPARPSVRSAPSVPTMVSTSSRSGVPAPTAPKYLRTSKYLSTPSSVAPRTTSSRSSIPTPVSRSSIPSPASRSPVAKATSIPSPPSLSPGASFLKRFDEKHPTSTRSSLPVPVARSPVAPRTTSSRSAPQKTTNGPSATPTRSSPSVAPRTTSSRSSIP